MFKNLIRERRQQLGLSQTKLACMIGVAESTLSDLELGKRQSWPKIRKALSRVLGLAETELFPTEVPIERGVDMTTEDEKHGTWQGIAHISM